MQELPNGSIILNINEWQGVLDNLSRLGGEIEKLYEMIEAKKSAIYIPAYSSSMRAAAIQVSRSTNIQQYVALNPASGPGTAPRQDILATANELIKNDNVLLLGYVSTQYGNRSIPAILTDIKRWAEFYPQVDGIMFDEVSTDSAQYDHYAQLCEMAKDEGFYYIKGNPGVKPKDERFIAIFDSLSIYENSGLPTDQVMKDLTFNGKYSKHKFAITSHSVPSLNWDMTRDIVKYFGVVYITDKVMPNPYDAPATYLTDEVKYLSE